MMEMMKGNKKKREGKNWNKIKRNKKKENRRA